MNRAHSPAPNTALSTRTVAVTEVNWLGDQPFEGEIACLVRIRSTRPPRPAILRPLPGRRAEVELLDPEDGVSPGQACVFYEAEGTRVLGGGWISLRRRPAA